MPYKVHIWGAWGAHPESRLDFELVSGFQQDANHASGLIPNSFVINRDQIATATYQVQLNRVEGAVLHRGGSDSFFQVVLIEQLAEVEFLIILNVDERVSEPQRVSLVNQPLAPWGLL
jgi:hypothetical protein